MALVLEPRVDLLVAGPLALALVWNLCCLVFLAPAKYWSTRVNQPSTGPLVQSTRVALVLGPSRRPARHLFHSVPFRLVSFGAWSTRPVHSCGTRCWTPHVAPVAGPLVQSPREALVLNTPVDPS